ncbi:hypothetical protein V8C40DRAFT_243701 [Trichoderma camerunense]
MPIREKRRDSSHALPLDLILFSPSGVAQTSKVDHLFNPSLLSASSSPSSPVTRETGKDKHSQLCQVGGEESQNTKCTCTCTCAQQIRPG